MNDSYHPHKEKLNGKVAFDGASRTFIYHVAGWYKYQKSFVRKIDRSTIDKF